MKKLLILLGAISLAFTLSTAEGKCNKDNAKKEMKCESGKCASDKNKGLVNFKSQKGITKYVYTEQKQVLKRYTHFRV